ncbi:MAG TPA: asparagine synthase-related protein [Candidatus Acidoferrum sp.]|nr:asparagine synthase-related protein [Candidatus Acidoferrum sp.]
MSGIVGFLNLNGAPIDRALLWRMTHDMEFLGPDAQEIWADGCVGLGHAMFRTTFEAAHEKQPYSLDQQIWITADARIDGRRELIDKLVRKGRIVGHDVPDAELIVYAYHVWGDGCVDHLIGDFAFAIWDRPKRRMFCARDHFGVKPFFYVRTQREFIFSNTLASLRLHPLVSDALNDTAVVDFLLFERNSYVDRTTFRDILKLPPAHTLVLSAEGAGGSRRYWSLPLDTRIRYSRREEYIDHFRSILSVAVADRLRVPRVSISMSGGLDSPSIAATARAVGGTELRAFTMVYDHLMPDSERHYSGLVAKHLDIPIHYQVVDAYKLYERWKEPGFMRPEPIHAPLDVIGRDVIRRASADARVILRGDGGDPLFIPSGRRLATLLASGRLLTIAESAAWLWRTTRRFPPMGFRTALTRGVRRRTDGEAPPEWLNARLQAELDIRARMSRDWRVKDVEHPRFEAYNSLIDPYWAWCFEQEHSGALGERAEMRYPLFDLRIVEFAIGIPPIPWCVEKNLLRAAMRGALPNEVLRRPKTPLASDGIWVRRRQACDEWREWLEPSSGFGDFVDLRKLPRDPPDTMRELADALLPVSLNLWLRHLSTRQLGKGAIT